MKRLVSETAPALAAPRQAFVETFVRPGCAHVIVNAALLPAGQRERLRASGAAGVAESLLRLGGWQGASSGGSSSTGAGAAWAGDMVVGAGLGGQAGGLLPGERAGDAARPGKERTHAPVLLACTLLCLLPAPAPR